MLFRAHLSSAVLVALAVAGCAPGSKLKTVPVSGKVTFKGAPLAGATVAFVQTVSGTETAPASASGVTNSEGVYKLVTFETPAKPSDGAVPGKYKVIIHKREAATTMGGPMQGVDPSQMAEKMKNMTPEEVAKMSGQPVATSKAEGEKRPEDAKSEIPELYGDVNKTPLEAEVKASGAQKFDFELKE